MKTLIAILVLIASTVAGCGPEEHDSTPAPTPVATIASCSEVRCEHASSVTMLPNPYGATLRCAWECADGFPAHVVKTFAFDIPALGTAPNCVHEGASESIPCP
jgi:hypothetical protein